MTVTKTTTTSDRQQQQQQQQQEKDWTKDARIYEYGMAANPDMKPIPVVVHPPELHESGPTRIIPFDLSECMEIDDEDNGNNGATSPNLMASFVRVIQGESIPTQANATSQAFYVIRGSGTSTSQEHGTIEWSTGDMFVVPATEGPMQHTCTSANSAALYWVHDQPLLDYLGVTPSPGSKKFEATLYKSKDMLDTVEEIRHDEKRSNNRLGVLLGNAKCDKTKTLTHVLWSLLNSIPANTVQRPHRHNSVALDLCVGTSPNVYTLMGREIDDNGFIIDPIRCDWAAGGVFVTPPGWWHSHHNESNDVAWVLPIQDAGLFTHQRTLDIRFVDDELALHHAGRIRGSAFKVTDDQFTKMKQLTEEVENNHQATYEAQVCPNTSIDEVQEEEIEEEGDDDDFVPAERRERSGSIQVGALGRETASKDEENENDDDDGIASILANIKKPTTKSTHIRRKSIQVGADLDMLRKTSAITASPLRRHKQ